MTVTRGPQLAHTVSSRLSRVRMGPGPTVRHMGGLSRSQGTSPGEKEGEQVRAQGSSTLGTQSPQRGPSRAPRAPLAVSVAPRPPPGGTVAVPSCLHLCPTPDDGTNQRTWPGPEQGSHLPTRRCRLTSGQVRAVSTETGCSLEPHRTPVAALSCRGARWEMRRKWGRTLERQAGAAGPGRQDGACRWPASAGHPALPPPGPWEEDKAVPSQTLPLSQRLMMAQWSHAVHKTQSWRGHRGT